MLTRHTARLLTGLLIGPLIWMLVSAILWPGRASARTIYTSVGNPATATLSNPSGVFATSDGSIYIADTGSHRIRKVSPAGTITTVAGTGAAGFSGDSGLAVNAQLQSPTGIFVLTDSTIYIADRDNHRVRRVDPTGTITTVAGNGIAGYSGEGTATTAQLRSPTGVFVDASNRLYIADRDNHRIRRVSGTTISTVAGTGAAGFSGDGGVPTSAQLRFPEGVFVEGSSVIYIADRDNHRIRKVSGSKITTVAGNDVAGFFGDGGPATSASLAFPTSVWLETSGNLLIADRFSQRVRQVAPDSTISTLAGTGEFAFSGEGGLATSAALKNPRGVFANNTGVFVADSGNNVIRFIPILHVSTAVSGPTGVTGIGAGEEVVILRVGIRGDGSNSVRSVAFDLSDMTTATGSSATDLTSFKVYRSDDALLDGSDALLLTNTDIRLDSTNTLTLPQPDLPPSLIERFYLVTAAVDTIAQEGHAFRVGFPAGGIVTSRGGIGVSIATSNANRVEIDIVANRLLFTRQPGGSVTPSEVVLSTSPVVVAADRFGNVDTSFSDVVTLSTNAPGSLQNNTATPDSGMFVFSNLIYSAVADNEDFHLIANDEIGGVEGDLPTASSITLRSNIFNDPPRLSIPTITIDEDGFLRAKVTELVNDPDDTLFTWVFVSNHIQGQVDGQDIVLSPEADWSGTDTLYATVTDEHGASHTDQAIFEVRPRNDGPRLSFPSQFSVFEDDTLGIDLSRYASDPDTPRDLLTWEFAATTGLFWQHTSTDSLKLWVVPDSSGSYTMSLRVADNFSASSRDTFDVLILPLNDPPFLAVPDTIMLQQTVLSLQLADYVHDPDDPLSALSWSGIGDANIQVEVDSAGRAKVRPDSSWYGMGQVIFAATDTAGTVGIDTVGIEVQRFNLAPILSALPDIALAKGDTQTLELGSYAFDPDDANDSLSWQVSGARQGTASFVGSALSYAASIQPGRIDTLTVEISDPLGRTDRQTLRVTITNEAPSLHDLPDLALVENGTATLSLDPYAGDDGLLEDLTWHAEPDSGLVTDVRADRVLVILPQRGWSGEARVLVRVTDVEGDSDTDSLRVVVTATPEIPNKSADFDGSGLIDLDDFLRFADHFGTFAGAEQWDPLYDLNNDGAVDFDDMFIFSDIFGSAVEISPVQVGDIPDLSLFVGEAESLSLDTYLLAGQANQVTWSVTVGSLAETVIDPISHLATVTGQATGQEGLLFAARDVVGNVSSDSVSVTVFAPSSTEFFLELPEAISVRRGHSTVLGLDSYVTTSDPVTSLIWTATATTGIDVGIRDRIAFIIATENAPATGQLFFTATQANGEQASGSILVDVR
jgi:hypothetical protein